VTPEQKAALHELAQHGPLLTPATQVTGSEAYDQIMRHIARVTTYTDGDPKPGVHQTDIALESLADQIDMVTDAVEQREDLAPFRQRAVLLALGRVRYHIGTINSLLTRARELGERDQ
jgi:hypothetical protein